MYGSVYAHHLLSMPSVVILAAHDLLWHLHAVAGSIVKFSNKTKYLAENVTDMYRKVMVGDVARKYKRKKIKI